MSEHGKTVVCVLSGLVLCLGSKAIVADSGNPYQGIVDRNVFGLKPPPPPATNSPPPVNLAPMTLTGITTILGSPRALMNLQPPGKPIQSFILAQGQRDGEIEVLEIDENAGSVKVNQSGTVTTLTFEKNGVKLPASVAAASPPPAPGAFAPQPGAPYVPPNGQPAGGLKAIPTRQLRVPTPGQGGPGAGFRPAPGQQQGGGPPVPQ